MSHRSLRLVLGADLHGGDRCEEDLKYALSLWSDAYVLAEQNYAEGIVWLGDLIHFKYGMSAKLLLKWSEISDGHRMPNYLIRGNHDTPWKSDPESTVLELIRGVQTVTRPLVTTMGNTLIAMLPWYPPAMFEKLSLELASIAMNHNGPKFLLSHVSLAEGVASISNIRIEEATRAKHLYPDTWTHVFLGDYHAHQTIGDKITYLGAPRPTTFGDFDCVGLWLLTVEASGAWSLTPLELPSRYPKFYQIHLGFNEAPIIPQYDPVDKYSVTAPVEMHKELLRRYPEIKVKRVPGDTIVPTQQRTLPEKQDIWSVTQQWIADQQLNPIIYGPIARRLLEYDMDNTKTK